MEKLGIIYATDTLLQNVIKIVSLRLLTFDNFNNKPCKPCWITVRQLFKIRVVFHTLFLWNKVGDPNFFCISDTSNSLSDRSKKIKEIYRVENFGANVLKNPHYVYNVHLHWIPQAPSLLSSSTHLLMSAVKCSKIYPSGYKPNLPASRMDIANPPGMKEKCLM